MKDIKWKIRLKLNRLKERLSYIKWKIRFTLNRLKERLSYPKDIFANTKEFVYLRAWHSGLGDALALSTLPEEIYKQTGKYTYVLKSYKFRNSEIYDLVWGSNPYVIGKKEGPWLVGDPPHVNYENIYENIILNFEFANGLVPKNIYPKIYYKFNELSHLKNSFIVDLHSASVRYNKEVTKKALRKIKDKYPNHDFLHVLFKNSEKNNPLDKSIFKDFIFIKDIFEYCDVIKNAAGYVAYASGGSQLSAAIKGDSDNLKNYCLIDEKNYNYHKKKGIFLFPNIEYILMKSSLDYWEFN